MSGLGLIMIIKQFFFAKGDGKQKQSILCSDNDKVST